MTESSPITTLQFRRILLRNITVPLVVGVVNIAFFSVLVLYLLSVFRFSEHSETVLSKSYEIMKLSVDMQTGLRGYLLTGDPDFLEPRNAAKSRFTADLSHLESLVSDNASQLERLGRVEAMMADWDQYAQTVIDLRSRNQEFVHLVRLRGSAFDQVRTEMASFQAAERQLLAERTNRVKSVTNSAVAGYLLLSLALAGLVSWFSRRELTELSQAYNSSLAEAENYARTMEQQAWQRSGQAELVEKCTGLSALPALGQAVLDFLGSYLQVAVSVMYVRDRDTGMLTRVAGYGLGETDIPTRHSLTDEQTLVAQAVRSRRLLRLDQLPDHYLTISSGLGESKPRSLVLVPLLHEGQANGVLELGFLQEPQAEVLEFLLLVAPNLGATVEMALGRRRLQTVLEETQQLNEELQVQQEELRTTNDELEEQARALEESTALLENQKAELEQSNERLADQALMLDERNTALNKAQAELERRAQDLQRASKYKSEFLANMSHELRTPLNSSMILAKLLAENAKQNLDDEQVRFAQSIYASGNDLLNLINDILDISKVEAGKLELHPEHVPLEQVLDGLRLTFEPLAAQKHLRFTVQLEPGTPPRMYTDTQRLEQILRNLLSNAIKFTEAGYVTLSVGSAGVDRLKFAVVDSGIGIAEDQQQAIFEAFQQAEGGISRRYGGSGLGLAISRDLAGLLGGSIELDSAPGRGSTFTLMLPLAMAANVPPPRPAPTLPAPPALETRREPPARAPAPAFEDDRASFEATQRSVLVIEDDLAFAGILFNLAHELGYQCLVGVTAAEGLTLAGDYAPDAILLDLGLPDTSGINVLQRLKTDSHTRHIPVHIISAEDRTEAALQMGAVGYVIKPTTKERLQEVFHTLEAKLEQKTKRVLLVEDDKRQREAIIKLIDDDDVEIVAVEFGEQALNHLRDTIFDCMIIDLRLPDMQGHELLQRMSAEDLCCFPPVIVYTGRNLTRDEEHELLKYSRSIIIKGARSPERLLDEVTLFLHKVESELSAERQTMLKTARGRDRAFEGRRILVVDDDVRNVFALTGALEQKGALVEIARNGYEALNKLEECADIDVVLMDIMMPGMDGLEATRRIRADSRFEKLPIIAITAKAMKDDHEECLRAGASDYMSKPIDLDRLYSLIRVWMPNMERTP